MQEQLEEYKGSCELEEGWILVCKHAEGGDRLVPVESTDRIQRQQQLFGVDYKPVIRSGDEALGALGLVRAPPACVSMWLLEEAGCLGNSQAVLGVIL